MALVKGYRFTWGGGIFRPKPCVFDRSLRSPSKNTVKNSTEDTCSWTRPSKIGKRKVKKKNVFFNFLTSNFWFATSFFCGSAGGLARKRIFEFLDLFSAWFSSFCDSRNTGFYRVFLFSSCLTASCKTAKNIVNYGVLCYGVNENIVNTSVFWRWFKTHCKLQCFWPPDPQKQWYLQWFLLLTVQNTVNNSNFAVFFPVFRYFWNCVGPLYMAIKFFEGSLEAKLPTIWTDGTAPHPRRRSEMEKVTREKTQVREKVGKSRNTVFFQCSVVPEVRKVGSLKRRVRSQLTRWRWKIARRCGANHIWKWKCTKRLRSDKLHRRKSARRCGAKHMWKWKCTKRPRSGALLEVKMWKKHM